MSFTKTRDWDTETDGAAPVRSRKFANAKCVVLDGPNGEYFGWEDEDGNLFPGTVLTENASAVAVRNALHPVRTGLHQLGGELLHFLGDEPDLGACD